jgi:hypothetical protein
VLAWRHIAGAVRTADTWLAPFPLLVASLLLGYLLKPAAIVVTERLATQLIIRRRYRREILQSEDKVSEYEKAGIWPFNFKRFPFDIIFKGTKLYDEVEGILKHKLKLDYSPNDFPGAQIFATAKSYLKVVSPMMWEESERREAEVRMAGVMYLAFCFSALMNFIVLIDLSLIRGGDWPGIVFWLLLSCAGVFVTGESFSIMRVSEVGYTYLNTFVACRRSHPAGEAHGDDDPNAATPRAANTFDSQIRD